MYESVSLEELRQDAYALVGNYKDGAKIVDLVAYLWEEYIGELELALEDLGITVTCMENELEGLEHELWYEKGY